MNPAPGVSDRLREAALRVLRGDTPAQAARTAGYPDAAAFARDSERNLHAKPESLKAWRAAGRYRIDYQGPFHLDQTLAYLGRDPANLSERVVKARYRRWFPSAEGPVLTELHLGERVCTVTARRPRSAERALDLHERLVRFLGLSQPLAAFYRVAKQHPVMGPLVERFPGVRIPQLPTLWEALCWAIIGQQINLAFAYRLRNRFIAVVHGVPADAVPEQPLAFPEPAQVLDLTPELLLAQQFSRQKARYLLGLAVACHEGELAGLEAGTQDWERVEALLLAQTGLGPWSTAYAMMRGLGYLDGLPVGDSGLRTALHRAFNLKTPPTVAEQERLMEPLRPYRSLATYYLWKSLASPSTD